MYYFNVQMYLNYINIILVMGVSDFLPMTYNFVKFYVHIK